MALRASETCSKVVRKECGARGAPPSPVARHGLDDVVSRTGRTSSDAVVTSASDTSPLRAAAAPST